MLRFFRSCIAPGVALLLAVAGCDTGGYEDPVPPGVSLDPREATSATGGVDPAGGQPAADTAAASGLDTAPAGAQDTTST